MPLKTKQLFFTNLFVTLLYLIVGGLTFAASAEFSHIARVIFVPAGGWLAISLLFGPRAAVFGILFGQTLLSYYGGPSVVGGFFIALFNVLACVVGCHLFQRWQLDYRFSKLRDVTLFSVLIFFILEPISATGSMLALALLDSVPNTSIPHALHFLWSHSTEKPIVTLAVTSKAWLSWWLGGVIGHLLIAPLLMAWLRPAQSNVTPSKKTFNALEIIGGAVAISAIVVITLSNIPFAQLLVLAITYPLLVWSGLRHGLRSTTLINVLIALFLIVLGVSGHGFISHFPLESQFYYIGFFIITTTLFSLILFSMFEERRFLIQQLTELASTDFLTKLGNRSYFIERGEQAIAQARRHQQPLSLAILDIDRFKKINDTYGHLAGDEVIKSMAQQCKSTLRTEDTSSRIGGEEFALLLPNTTKEDAYQTIERLRLKVQDLAVTIDNKTQINVTFSAGIAQLDLDINSKQSLTDLLGLADKMLYQSKKAGRNQTSIYPLASTAPTA